DATSPKSCPRPGPLLAATWTSLASMSSAACHEPSPSPSATTMTSSPFRIAAIADDKHFAKFVPPRQTGIIIEHVREAFAPEARSAGVAGDKEDAAAPSIWLFISVEDRKRLIVEN